MKTITCPAPINWPNAIRDFEEKGYAVLPGFLAGDILEQTYAALDDFIKTIVPNLPEKDVYYEARGRGQSLKQIQHLQNHSAFFADLFHGIFLDAAEKLLREKAVGKVLQYFDKPPYFNSPTPPHQDGYYFMIEPCHAVTMWLALDEVGHENGCLRYVSGSHRDGLRAHGVTETLGFSQAIVDFPKESDAEREVAILAHPGDLVVHSAMTIHRAGANTSLNAHRRAMGFMYYAQNVKEKTEAKADYTQKLSERLKKEGKI